MQFDARRGRVKGGGDAPVLCGVRGAAVGSPGGSGGKRTAGKGCAACAPAVSPAFCRGGGTGHSRRPRTPAVSPGRAAGSGIFYQSPRRKASYGSVTLAGT